MSTNAESDKARWVASPFHVLVPTIRAPPLLGGRFRITPRLLNIGPCLHNLLVSLVDELGLHI